LSCEIHRSRLQGNLRERPSNGNKKGEGDCLGGFSPRKKREEKMAKGEKAEKEMDVLLSLRFRKKGKARKNNAKTPGGSRVTSEKEKGGSEWVGSPPCPVRRSDICR